MKNLNGSKAWLAIKDIKTWASAIALFGIDLTTFGLTVFLPIIIESMGFTSVKVNLMTVPVYFFNCHCFLCMCQMVRPFET